MKALKYKKVQAFAPASIGNVAAGFDVLGLAVEPLDGALLGDRVTVEAAEGHETTLAVRGRFADRLPSDPETNLVLICRGLFEAALGEALPPLKMTLHKDLPLSSGLGSSSASVVASLVALNAAFGDPLGDDRLLALAGEGEGVFSGAPHLDNVAPALMGGMVLLRGDGAAQRLPWPDLPLALVHPDIEVPTALSRGALPAAVPLKDAVAYWQNLACFVDGIHRGDLAWIAAGLQDVWVQGHRAHLVPGFAAAMEAASRAGALGSSLSGSGPSVFAVAETLGEADAARAAMVACFERVGLRTHAWVCRPSAEGARVLVRA